MLSLVYSSVEFQSLDVTRQALDEIIPQATCLCIVEIRCSRQICFRLRQDPDLHAVLARIRSFA